MALPTYVRTYMLLFLSVNTYPYDDSLISILVDDESNLQRCHTFFTAAMHDNSAEAAICYAMYVFCVIAEREVSASVAQESFSGWFWMRRYLY